jgi:Kdo2-lipid IVA lauroyltransferase/acyltransferase
MRKWSALPYYVALPFIYLVSVLPFPILYLLSDLLCFLLFKVFRYREDVITSNLRHSFPAKSAEEIRELRNRFHRYFCDLTLETFKTLTIKPAKMLRHCALTDTASGLFDRLAAENRSFIIVMGHKGNWEWAGNTFSILARHQLYVIYHPLSNSYFNSLICGMRTKFGTRLIPMKETFKEMVRNRQELNATAFIADQSPRRESAYWMTFLHQDTPVFTGTEKIAIKLNLPIVYVSVKKIRRGYYTVDAELLMEPPYDATDGFITTVHTKRLEQDIIEQPETWLWTHRRWKHKR